MCVCGGGGSLTFSYIRRLESFLGVQNFEFQYFFIFFFIFFFGGGGGGGFRKINISGGMKILWIFSGHFYAF